MSNKGQVKKTPNFPRPMSPTTMPLGDVYFNKDWNGREKSRYTVPDGDVSTGLQGLCNAMRADGQRTPIDVRPNPWKSKEHPQPFAAITGFRRGEAIAMAVHDLNIENENDGAKLEPRNTVEAGIIHVYIHDSMQEPEAVLLNATENLAREGLESADVAFEVWRLRTCFPKATHAEIANLLTLSQPWVSQLIAIKEGNKDKGVPGCLPEICLAWRAGDPRHPLNPTAAMLSVDEMTEISKLPHVDQVKAFTDKLAGKKRGGAGRGNWQEGAKRDAETIGAILGTLHRLQYIDASEIDWADAMFGSGAESPPALGMKLHKDVYEKSETGGLTQKAVESRAILVNAAMTAYAQAQIVKTDTQVRAEQSAGSNPASVA